MFVTTNKLTAAKVFCAWSTLMKTFKIESYDLEVSALKSPYLKTSLDLLKHFEQTIYRKLFVQKLLITQMNQMKDKSLMRPWLKTCITLTHRAYSLSQLKFSSIRFICGVVEMFSKASKM